MKFIENYKYNIFIAITFVLLTISYGSNVFKITDNNYKHFDKADEGNVLGRMVLSREKGIFYKGAITGQYFNYKYSEKELNSSNPPLRATDKSIYPLSQLYNDYINDREIYDGNFHPYKSQPGGHAMLYSVLQKISPFDGNINLSFFRLFTITLSALAFALFAGWIYRNFGLTTASITFLLILLSPWLYRFAFNLWWALWSFYIPFLTMLLVLERRKKNGAKMFDNKLLVYLCIAVYVKFFFTGAEFITSALVAAVSPIIYYLFLENSKLKDKLIYFIKASAVSCLTIVVGLLQLAMQIRYLDGTWADGFNHVLFSYRRHNTDSDTMVMDVPELFLTYFKENPFYWDFLPIFRFGFGVIVLVVSLTSVYIWFSSKGQSNETNRKNKALVFTTAISILSPLSWLAFFPAHAAYHTFLDFIIWYIPYCILGFAVIGVGIDTVIKRSSRNKKDLFNSIQA